MSASSSAPSGNKLQSDLPQHVAIIMDGNGRWAKNRGLSRLEGHRAGAEAARKVVEQCCRREIKNLTLFSFSTENWNRSSQEVSGLMSLFRKFLDTQLDDFRKNNIRLSAVGDLERLPADVFSSLKRNMELTKGNTRLNLVLAVSYGGREEILSAVRTLAASVQKGNLSPQEITAEIFSSALWTAGLPNPDLLIRTSGEFRISNFLLWQLAYTEIIVRPELWPDFVEKTLDECLMEYSLRERRFGLTSEQIRQDGVHGPLSS